MLAKSDKNLILIVSGLLVVTLAYFVYCTGTLTEANDLDRQTESLSISTAELRTHVLKRSAYEEAIAEAISTIESEFATYPAAIQTEDLIQYAVDIERTMTLADPAFSSLSFPDHGVVSLFTLPDANEVPVPYAALTAGMSVNGRVAYGELKSMLRTMRDDTHTSLETLSLTYDAQFGGLMAVFSIRQAFITDTLELPQTSNALNGDYGTALPFGTVR